MGPWERAALMVESICEGHERCSNCGHEWIGDPSSSCPRCYDGQEGLTDAIQDTNGLTGYPGCPDCDGSGLAFSKTGMGKPCQRCRDRQDLSGAAQPSGLYEPGEDNGCGVCGGTGFLRGKPCQYCPDEDGW